MKKRSFLFILPIFLLMLNSCNQEKKVDTKNPADQPWEKILANAKGKTVVMNMYQGFKKGNNYMNEYVIPTLKKEYDITLKIVSGQGKEIVNNVMAEKESGSAKGQIDLCWINGETFYQLMEIEGLYGPYSEKLPNAKYIDFTDPIIKYDFQTEVKGFETPWSKSSFLVITDTSKVKKIPVTMQEFETYWQQNPGKFTLAQDFMGLTLLKSWLVEIAGGIQELEGPLDEAKYKKYSTQLWEFVNRNKKYFWKKGETFPASNVTISQMFGTGEVNFTFAFGNNDVDEKVDEGLYPVTARSYILKAGSTYNTNYVGIPFNSANKEAAMVVCNFLISPEAQIKKSDLRVWGGGLVLDYNKMETADKQKYDALPKLKYGLPEAEIKQKSIKETEPKYMIRVDEDFRKYVIDAK